MSDRSVVIIGAGLAGLAAGCYARMNGYRSHIFEYHSKPGGVAAAWKRQPYLIDGGIHFLMGHRPGQPIYDLYRELGAMPEKGFPDLTNYGRFIHESSGRLLDVTPDLDRLESDLQSMFPADSRIIVELVGGAREMRRSNALFQMGLASPPEMSGPLGGLKQLWAMRADIKYFTGKYSWEIHRYAGEAHDPVLLQFLENLFLPEAPVWFVMMLLALLADRQIGLLNEGCRDFVQRIESRYTGLGGEISYKSRVQQILVEGNRAVGVRLADGTEHRADAVISAADGYSTIFDMLGGRFLNTKIRQRYENWKLIRPVVMISFGVAREFPQHPSLSLLLLKDQIVIGGQTVAGFSLRIFNYGSKFAPPGKTVLQVMLETEWDFWFELQKDRPRYEAEKQRLANEVLRRLEAHLPGVSQAVEVTDVATPYTTWRYTLNHKGAYMGWMPTPSAIMTSVPRTLPGLADFYMAGQWVMPGGGVPTCIISGKNAVQLMCRRDGKKFVSSAE